MKDPYQLLPEDIEQPPATFSGALKRIGPGMILAASIVGSGELIATTNLGAQIGYVGLWIVLLSCFIKPVIQAELGRFTIASGETGLAGLNRVPGPRFKLNWVVVAWFIMTMITLMQLGAMFGGVAQVLNLLVPAISVPIWVLLLLGLTLALLLGGGYERIEGIAVIKVALFTLLTLLSALLLTQMPQYFSWSAAAEGLKFKMPEEGLSQAVAVFGIVGVGASELLMYPYWCVEKGYARFAGRYDGSYDWVARARGWVKVMHVDILASMLIYTVATIAFFLLGAGVLHGMGLVPGNKETEMISVLSNIYTQTFGGWAKWLFYAGAIITLYGTIFAATAANSRVFADMMRLTGLFRGDDYATRVKFRNGYVIGSLIIPVLLFFYFKTPVKMVIAGGIAQSLMLPIIGIGTLVLHHRYVPKELRPSKIVTIALWLTTIIISCLMAYWVKTRF
ncbi:MAG: Nramp family divalent metal transporter [Blastocatellia bacterium]|nr:Nramp family divalent metal transporter [Blastocatellia bacterium]